MQREELKSKIEDLISKSGLSDREVEDCVYYDIYNELHNKQKKLEVKRFADILTGKYWAYKSFESDEEINSYIYVTSVFGTPQELIVDCMSVQFAETQFADENYVSFDVDRQIVVNDADDARITGRFTEITKEEFLSHVDGLAAKAPLMMREWLDIRMKHTGEKNPE